MSALTLPGAPGRLRLGSVVRSIRSERDVPPGARGVVVQALATGAFIVAFRWSDDPADVACEAFEEVNADDVALDLTDATGRAHAAWWLAGEVGAAWVLSCDGFRRWELHGGERPRHSLSRAWQGVGAEMRRMGLASSDWVDCPALDALDPDDPRLLPDGSRWVDAEALRRVCLHVAGVTP